MYYPKSQIKPNQITNGEEYVYSNTNTLYSGSYFTTGDGLIFTGNNPNDKPNDQLELVNPTVKDLGPEFLNSLEDEHLPNSYDIIDESYYWAKGISINTTEPVSVGPLQIYALPTEADYKVGEFQRFFVKKSNQIQYTEISNTQYNKFIAQDNRVDYFLYIPFKLPWVITGNRNEVSNVNKNTIERISSNGNLIGFKSYFKNRYDQYFRYTSTSNLTTNGTEFLNERTGKRYVGLYHIHPKKGPMVGAEHTTQIHDYLIPVSGSNMDYKVNKIETQNNQNKNTKSVGY